jgi:N-acylneuraminate cytidylyltransferase
MSAHNLAIITARGGSKRIPRKNIRTFHGKPIIAYSISAALESKCFGEVMVSTDDAEIARIAVENGAVVPFMRSQKTSDDHATTSDVILEVLETYRELGRTFTNVCCLYPTAPFITPDLLCQGHSKLVSTDAPAVIPVAVFSPSIWWALSIVNDRLDSRFPDKLTVRSQDLELSYFDTGQFYWLKVENILTYKSISFAGAAPLICDGHRIHDIDTEDDWKIAEMKFAFLNNSG